MWEHPTTPEEWWSGPAAGIGQIFTDHDGVLVLPRAALVATGRA
ncbi:hypothetical protein [Streptomyces sp. NRRL S-237]|nr:hypothetical protein [Streptomyces sp. NRRL S-237]